MAKPEPRRSQRLGTYDSNGRDYLSCRLGWTRPTFEEWIYSPSVRPHLQLWYADCISNAHRFNFGIEWINTGTKGYFYNESDLEEDLLLMCLCAGNDGKDTEEADGIDIDFVSDNIDTTEWSTQEIWARTAWRIVQTNRGDGQVFYHTMKDRPATAYSLTIELLCISFHSIAFRGADSVYLAVLKGGQDTGVQKTTNEETFEGNDSLIGRFEAGAGEDFSGIDAFGTADNSSDATFTDFKEETRAMSELSTVIVKPKAAHAQIAAVKIDSQVLVHQADASSSTTKISLKTAYQSSVEGEAAADSFTPKTDMSGWAKAFSGFNEMQKNAAVRQWLEKMS